MSLLSDILGGNIGNALHDLNPANILSDAGPDLVKAVSNPLLDAAVIGGIALPMLGPELIGLAGGGGAAEAGLGAAAGADAASAIGGTSLAAAEDAILPATAELTSGMAPADLITQDFGTIGPGADVGATAASGDVPLNLLGGVSSTPGAAATADTGILSQITSALSPISSTIKSASPIIGAGGLAYNLLQGQQQRKAQGDLNALEAQKSINAANIASADTAAARPLLASGQTLTQYLATGTLPPEFDSQVKQQIAAAKASIIQGYGARGQSTNPQQNSALAQDLTNVDMQAQTLRTSLEATLNTAGTQMMTVANQLLASGLSATQLSAELPIQMSQLDIQLNKAMSDSIANFAAALNGSVPGGKNAITLKLPQDVIGSQGQLNA